MDVQSGAVWGIAVVAVLLLLLSSLPSRAQTERVRLSPIGGSRPEYVRHPMQCVTTTSGLAFAGIGPAMAIFDVSDPNNPLLRGGYVTTGFVQRIEVVGSYAYVATDGFWDGSYHRQALEILDVSDPTRPLLVGSYDAKDALMDVRVAANRAYVVSGGTWTGSNYIGTFEILDVADPAHPLRMGSITTVWASRVNLVGNLAYLVASPCAPCSQSERMEIIDISNPIAPTRAGIYQPGQLTEGFRVAGSRAYLAGQRWTGTNWTGNVEIVDLTNPTNLVRAGSYDTLGYLRDVHVIGSNAFLAGASLWTGSNLVGNSFEILDVTNPTNAVLLASSQTFPASVRVHVMGDYAYLATPYAGLQIIDIRNSLQPIRAGSFDPFGFTSDVQVVNQYAYLSESTRTDENSDGALEIHDVSDPAEPVRVGRYAAPGPINGLHVVGSFAYLARSASFAQMNNAGSMEIVDVSNPARPSRIGVVVTRGHANHVQVVGQLAYVASALWTGSNQVGALEVFNIASPTNPIPVGTYNTAGAASDVQVVGNRAYLADGAADLLVLGVTNPGNPVFMGSYSTNVDNPWTGEPGGPSIDIHVVSNHVFAAGPDGLHVLDVSNPADPVRVSGFAHALFGVHVAGKYAFTFAALPVPPNGSPATGFLTILDVTDPENFVGVSGEYPGTSWIASKIQMVSNRVYVAAGNAGLLIFELQTMQLPSITAVSREGAQLIVSWPGAPGLKLQRTESLDDPDWMDVPASDGQSRVELPIASGHEFFRLFLDW